MPSLRPGQAVSQGMAWLVSGGLPQEGGGSAWWGQAQRGCAGRQAQDGSSGRGPRDAGVGGEMKGEEALAPLSGGLD